MYDNILNKPLQLKPNISNSARHLLEGLLQKDRTKRLGCTEDFVSDLTMWFYCLCVSTRLFSMVSLLKKHHLIMRLWSFFRLKLRTTYSSLPSTGMTSMPRRSPLPSTPTWYVLFSIPWPKDGLFMILNSGHSLQAQYLYHISV